MSKLKKYWVLMFLPLAFIVFSYKNSDSPEAKIPVESVDASKVFNSKNPNTLAQQESSHLQGLNWLVGSWEDKDDQVEISTRISWDKSKNFLRQAFTVDVQEQRELSGTQIIAWDPAKKVIRSWLFDTDGGFGEAEWHQKGDNKWIVENAFTLPDGRVGSSINVYTKIDADSYSFESTGRQIEGEILPNIEPVKVVRKEVRKVIQ